jgi:uncharacterized protein
MDLDSYTIALLVKNPAGPHLREEDEAALQEAHMNHLADLHEAGHLLAAGPLAGEILRGLSILNVDPHRAQELTENDPAVRAGVYTIDAMPWLVPAGAMQFRRTRFPRSLADVRSA